MYFNIIAVIKLLPVPVQSVLICQSGKVQQYFNKCRVAEQFLDNKKCLHFTSKLFIINNIHMMPK